MTPFLNHAREASPSGVVVHDDVSVGGEATGTTSHSIDLPAGVAVGDVLVLMFRVGTDTVVSDPENVITLPAGWTEVQDHSGLARVATRVHQSGDPTTVSVTTSKSLRSTHQVYRFGGAHGDVAASTFTTAPSHNTVTPAWGSAENAIIAMVCGRWTSQTFTNPTNYQDQVYASNVAPGSSVADNCHIVTAHRILEAASETPGDWGITGTASQELTVAIAVRPAA